MPNEAEVLNHTSATVPMWQIDCDEFRKVGRVFELRDVTSDEHRAFVAAFARRNELRCEWQGATVTFLPKIRISKSPGS